MAGKQFADYRGVFHKRNIYKRNTFIRLKNDNAFRIKEVVRQNHCQTGGKQVYRKAGDEHVGTQFQG